MATGKVGKVVDGDTIDLAGGQRVRIANVDAPELGQPGGEAAKQKLQHLIPPGTQVGLSAVLAESYGRQVREVTLKGAPIKELLPKGRKQK